jgi:polyisoprenyl-phosphate glycosyltransferase
MSARERITAVAPAYNEADGIDRFVGEVLAVFESLAADTQLLVVDDGSTDGTREKLDALQEANGGRLGVLHLSRNFGHQAALTAGMDYAEADAVITMDADLQHPPALIPELVRRWKEGADIVQTVRRSSPHVGLLKDLTSRAFYAVINHLSSTRIEPRAADFRLLSRRIVEIFRRDIRERDRFLRGLVSWVGFRVATVEFDAPPRFAGSSKYSLGEMARLARVGMISFSKVPLKIAVALGVGLSGLSLLYGLYAIGVWIFMGKAVVPGWASIVLVSTFLGGANLVLVGVIGEYIASIFDEIKARPIYIVESACLPGARSNIAGSTGSSTPRSR